MLADYAVVLDANVLAEATLSDLFLRLAVEPRLLLPKWTEEILAETERAWLGKMGWDPKLVGRRLEQMRSTFPEALVTDYEVYLDRCQNEPEDRHILAAAIREKVETIVTMNEKHFKPEHLKPWGIVASAPDAYLEVLFDHHASAVVHAVDAMARDRRKPLDLLLSRLGQTAPNLVRRIGADLSIVVPPYDKEIYRSAYVD